jgi:hypothetical protein
MASGLPASYTPWRVPSATTMACVNAAEVSVVNNQWGDGYAIALSQRVGGCSRLP